MRKLLYVNVMLVVMTGSSVHADDKENVFKTFPGLAEFYNNISRRIASRYLRARRVSRKRISHQHHAL